MGANPMWSRDSPFCGRLLSSMVIRTSRISLVSGVASLTEPERLGLGRDVVLEPVGFGVSLLESMPEDLDEERLEQAIAVGGAQRALRALYQRRKRTMTSGGGVGTRLPRGGSAVTITRSMPRSEGRRIRASPERGTEKSAPVGMAAAGGRTSHAW